MIWRWQTCRALTVWNTQFLVAAAILARHFNSAVGYA
jgi:hypothetical protein